jgi:hypothetical protein
MAVAISHPVSEAVIHGAASSVATGVVAVMRAPFRGRVIEVGTVIGSATTTADATVTTAIAGTNITGGVFNISQSGSAAGQLNFASASGVGNNGATAGGTISGSNICNEGDPIKFTLSGSGTGGGQVYCYAVISRGNV